MDVLSNKSYKNYKKLSRYASFPYYYNSLFNKYNYSTIQYLSSLTDYQLYTIKANDSWDSIALEFYNNPTYYWIILSYNHIQDSLNSPPVGIRIRIPNISTIEFER